MNSLSVGNPEFNPEPHSPECLSIQRLYEFSGRAGFSSRRKDRVKILYWDRDGFAIWSKRLEEGTYAVPFDDGAERRREITAQELGALLSGIDLRTAKRRKRSRRADV